MKKKDYDKYLEIRKSRNGSGLFTKKKFQKSEIVLEVKGPHITCNEDDDLDEEVRSNTYRYSSEFFINPKGQFANFVNHSCNPNTKIEKIGKKLFIVAINPLNKGQEILFDYSTITPSDDSWEMKCNCGEKICRKKVGSWESLPKKVKDSYIQKSIIPDYILAIG